MRKFSLAAISFCLLMILGCATSKNKSLVMKDADMEVFETAKGVKFVRTPDERFTNLPEWNYEAKYIEIDGLRQAYVDEGPKDAPPILLLHGQPTWSYLYRHMIPVLTAKGYRVIAMDHLGMGRSDKPIDLEYHSFDNHLSRLNTFIKKLELKNLTVFMQDWGSVFGLYLAGSDQTVFDKIILGNGGLPIVKEPFTYPADIEKSNRDFNRMFRMIPDKQRSFFDKNGKSKLPVNDGSKNAGGFAQWMTYAKYYPEFQVSRFVEALTFYALSKEEKAAYDAPFPARIAMAGPRSFPSLLNDLVGRSEAKKMALKNYNKPFLLVFGRNDPGLSGDDTQEWVTNNIPGAKNQNHVVFNDASHYLQDDKGKEIAEIIIKFIKESK
jgi:haloalkane dehalogenase